MTRDQMHRRRALAATAIEQGLPVEKLVTRYHVSRRTANKWYALFKSEGADRLRERRFPQTIRVDPVALEQLIGSRDDWTALKLAAAIKEKLGVQYSESHA